MDTLTDLLARVEQLNAIGASLSSEHNLPHLLEEILLAAKAMTHADGGTLYRVSEDRRSLHFEIIRNDSLGIAYGGVSGQPLPDGFDDLPLYRGNGEANNALVVAYAVVHERTVNIADAYAAAGFDFSGTRQFDRQTGYRSQSFLTVPMKNHEHEIIGVLQLINAIDPETSSVVPFSATAQRFAESLASQAAVALTNSLLVNQLETLFESFVTLINLAIDEKSPYTGGHCQRVPALTMLLAETANAVREGPLAGFSMSDKERYELRIASLLHDCGKVTTPVHVVDKATKLQTIFDRIELLETRFEIVRRDAELAMWRAIHAGADREQAEQKLRDTLLAIESDQAFLRRANDGCEAMPEADQARVEDIAKRYRWTNAAGVTVDFLSDDEIENLSIRSGTLNPVEREIINRHVVATIRMLEALPWPKHLQRVPEYAGGHHERCDGSGYPRGLTGEQMSLPARMMAIADIFEALTARDRPYKHGMKLSEALRILKRQRNAGHIDPDLHDLFMRERVYLRYARQFLDPAQIDVTD